MKKSLNGFRSRPAACAITADAQDLPRMETFPDYTYVRANSATKCAGPSAPTAPVGGSPITYDKWLGTVADLGAVHNGNIGRAHR
jgi:hypothetical protein